MHICPLDGGLEAKDFAKILANMIEKYCNKKQYKINKKIEKENIISIDIVGNLFLLKKLQGIHKLIRVSPFGNGKVHTSLCSIWIDLQVEKKKIEINKKDIRIDFYKSSGPGGQHKNKTLSAVRITYLPTGLIVTNSDTRSQYDNKDNAFKQLEELLKKQDEEKKFNDMKLIWKDRAKNSNYVCSYFLNHKKICNEYNQSSKIQQVLDGDLELIW